MSAVQKDFAEKIPCVTFMMFEESLIRGQMSSRMSQIDTKMATDRVKKRYKIT